MEEQNILTPEQEQAELTKLKAKADEYGITYAHKIGLDTLQARISEYESSKTDTSKTVSIEDTNPLAKLFEGKSLRDDNVTTNYEANKNLHVKITCLDPDKTAWQGEFLCVGNAKNYIRKYYVYGKDYMVPQALVDVLAEKTFTQFVTSKNKLGHEVTKTKQSPAYHIEYLKDLTPEEIEAIRHNQLIHKDD